jgi:hypothetical protein
MLNKEQITIKKAKNKEFLIVYYTFIFYQLIKLHIANIKLISLV